MSDFKERMQAKMKEQGITSSQFLDYLTELFCDTDGLTTEEIREDLEAEGVNVDASTARFEKLLNKYGLSMKETP